MLNWEEEIYPRLPLILQNLACNYHGFIQRRLCYGGEFRKLLDWLEESQWWPKYKIEEYNNVQIYKLMQHAYETVPYYKRIFDERNLKPCDIQSVADLPKLPILTKEDIHMYLKDLISRKFSIKDLIFSHTSGSTGKSLKFYLECRSLQFRWAVWWRLRRRFGIGFGVPYATFTGLTAVPLNQEKPPFWRENYFMRQTVFTMHHMVPAKVEPIVKRLNEGGFCYYFGYPSILYSLACLIKEKGLEIIKPPSMIFTGAENLYDNQRSLISEVFRSPVTDHYGFTEGAGNASRCEYDVYHEDFEYGILECEEPDVIGEDMKQGRIIATGFGNYAMPFIRYDVEDIGEWKLSRCLCGRESRVLSKIIGRTEDYIITPEGLKIRRFDYIFKDTHNIKEAQVVQRELGSICLRIIKRSTYTKKDEDYLKGEINRKISNKLRVEFEYVKEIERLPNGKMQAVKSLIAPRP